jgi:hypothetical protein
MTTAKNAGVIACSMKALTPDRTWASEVITDASISFANRLDMLAEPITACLPKAGTLA